MNTHPLPTNWDPTGEVTRSLAHGHGLDTIDAYRLVTVDHATGATTIVGEFTDTEFGRAINLADQLNKGAIATGATHRYALDSHYTCGCYSTDR